jgi:hypothetical protein
VLLMSHGSPIPMKMLTELLHHTSQNREKESYSNASIWKSLGSNLTFSSITNPEQ